jgi:NAD-dependent dihydropyrimidine dehydrogenase PreA subunit
LRKAIGKLCLLVFGHQPGKRVAGLGVGVYFILRQGRNVENDAIVGAPKQIHAVVADACIACKRCVEVCPTECLQMHPIEVTLRNWRWAKPKAAELEGVPC